MRKSNEFAARLCASGAGALQWGCLNLYMYRMQDNTADPESSYTWKDAKRIIAELMRPEAGQVACRGDITAILSTLVSNVQILKKVLPELLEIMAKPLREKEDPKRKTALENLESNLALLGEEARASLEEKARIAAVVRKIGGPGLELS